MDVLAQEGSAAAQRPCPYCGTWNSQEFRFCQKCGKELPAPLPAGPAAPPAGPAAAAQGPAGPAPPSAEPAASPLTRAALAEFGQGFVEEAARRERALTDDERARLKRAARRPAAQATRPLGLLFGLAPALFIVMSMGGAPFVPEAAAVVLIAAGAVGFAMGVISMNARAGPMLASARGAATEVAGVAATSAGPTPRTTRVDLGSFAAVVPAAEAEKVRADALTRIAFVDLGIKVPAKGQTAGFTRGLLLDVNGAPPAVPASVLLLDLAAPPAAAPPSGKVSK